MELVIGVRFETAGKIYFFDPAGLELERGDHVIVETVRGLEYGLVVLSSKPVDDEKVVKPLRPVIRKATAEDTADFENYKKMADEAFLECKKVVAEEELEMKIVKAVYTFDGRKLMFYFSAEGRVDFRNLVRRLASRFRTRIELRQIGSRDATKKIGGLGSCGRPLCCKTFLTDFQPVSIKMVREQNVSMNPAKISGPCGRLMCCLSYEQEAYRELNKIVPKVGSVVQLNDTGEVGTVKSVNLLRQEMRILIDNDDDKDMVTRNAADVKVLKHGKGR